MSSSTPWFHSTKATVLSPIHRTCQIRQSHGNFASTPRNQSPLMSIPHWNTMLLSQSCHGNLFLSPANTNLLMHYPTHSAYHIGLYNHRNAQQTVQSTIINILYPVQFTAKDVTCKHIVPCGYMWCITPFEALGVLHVLAVLVDGACVLGGPPIWQMSPSHWMCEVRVLLCSSSFMSFIK